MADAAGEPTPTPPDWPAEVTRLNKVIRSLMDRAERSTSGRGSDFSLFQSTIMLEGQVHRRTAELEAALHENEKITRALRESEAKFRGMVSQSLVGICIIEAERLTYTNARFEEIFGYGMGEMRDMDPEQLAVDGDRALVKENVAQRTRGEVDHIHYVLRGLRKDGTRVDVECYGNGMEVGGKRLLISLFMDITERIRTEREVRALQARLREQSTHDALTSLYNRRYLEDTLGRELLRAERSGGPVSLVMGDLDHFKAINDRHGHLAGDEVLRVFGDLMKRQARRSDIYCRYGGEEFLLVLPGMERRGAVARAEQLGIALAAAPIAYGGSQITVTASFGVSAYPLDGRTGDELIGAADRALYVAKGAGRNRVRVSASPETAAVSSR